MKLEILRENIQTSESQLQELNKKSSTYSTIRLICLVAFCFGIFYGYYKEHLFYVLTGFALLIFLYVVKLHTALKHKVEELTAYIEVNEDIIKRKGSEWKHFPQQGSQYLDEHTTQEYDLDIFGKASLYQYICVAKTPLGKDRLASLLSCRIQKREDIIRRQEAVKECMQNTQFTLHITKLLKLFEKHAKKKRKKSLDDFFTYMEEDEKGYPHVLRAIFILLPAGTLISLFLTMFFNVTYAYVLIFATLSLAITFLSFLHSSGKLVRVDDSAEMMKDYACLLDALQKEAFSCEYLTGLKQQIKDADKGIQTLNQILSFVRLRSNGIMGIIFNAFVLMDFQCVTALITWKSRYGKHVRLWLNTIADLEAILSLAQIGLVKDVCVFPDVEEGRPHVAMQNVQHPLLMESSAIANSFQSFEGSVIITGSNMSGKTTFLRTIGVNMVLLHAGACVCATAFQATSMNFYTSMRVHDDVSEGISTFYAEILRIKEMMQKSDAKEPMLVLIDEIFKGTNSADRILCAKQAIVRLHLPWVLTMVSTHDFELCDLEFDKAIQAVNYHFSEYYEGDKICFDYTLKDGRCTTTNARQLMKLAGF